MLGLGSHFVLNKGSHFVLNMWVRVRVRVRGSNSVLG